MRRGVSGRMQSATCLFFTPHTQKEKFAHVGGDSSWRSAVNGGNTYAELCQGLPQFFRGWLLQRSNAGSEEEAMSPPRVPPKHFFVDVLKPLMQLRGHGHLRSFFCSGCQ